MKLPPSSRRAHRGHPRRPGRPGAGRVRRHLRGADPGGHARRWRRSVRPGARPAAPPARRLRRPGRRRSRQRPPRRSSPTARSPWCAAPARRTAMTGEVTESVQRFAAARAGPADRPGASTTDQTQPLRRHRRRRAPLVAARRTASPASCAWRPPAPPPITALDLLIGGRSLVVGQENGALSVWMPTREAGTEERFRLTRVRDFPRASGGHPRRSRRPSAARASWLLSATGHLGPLLLDLPPHAVDRQSPRSQRGDRPLLHPQDRRRLHRRRAASWRRSTSATRTPR